VLIFIVRLLGTCASLAVMSYFSHVLPVKDFGIYQGFWVQIAIPCSVACLGLTLLIYTYTPATLHRLIRSLKPAHYLGYALLLMLIAALFVFMRSGRAGASRPGGYIAFLFFVLYVLNTLLEPVLFVARQHRALLFGNTCYALLFVTAAVTQQRSGYDFDQLLAWLLPVAGVRLLLLLRGLLAFLKTRPDTGADPPVNRKHVLGLWLHLGFYDLSSALIQWIDKVIISFLCSAELAAVYFNGTVNIPFIGMALSAVGSATLMQLSTAGAAKEKVRLLREAGSVLSSIAFPLFFLLLAFHTEFITVVFSGKYLDAVPIFLCSILVLPVRAYSSTSLLQNEHKGSIINMGVLLDFVLALAIMYPLYLWLGLAGIALSFVVSTYCQFFFYLYHTSRLLQVPAQRLIPLRNWAYKIALSGLLAWGAHYVLSSCCPDWASLLTGGAVMGTTSLLLLRRERKQDVKA